MGMTEPVDLTDQEIFDRLAAWVVLRRLAAPAIFFLEANRPISFLGAQAMIAASPIIHVFESFLKGLAGPGYRHALYQRFAELLEDRKNVERLIVAIERESQQNTARERVERTRRKRRRRVARARRRARKRTAKRAAARQGEA